MRSRDNRNAVCRGGSEVYRVEGVELRAGDRVRWTRNHQALGLVNSHTAEVAGAVDGRVSFRLEDGCVLSLNEGDPQLGHFDYAWASSMHALQGRTVDNVIAAMEANHPHLTTQKGFYVEVSHARDRAKLVTDDATRLHEQFETATGARISALEGIGQARPDHTFAKERDATDATVETPGETSRGGARPQAPVGRQVETGMER